MRRISTAELRRWVLVGLGVGTLVSLLLGILLTGDWGGLLLNVGAEFGGALATYGLLELLIRRREESEAKEKERKAKRADLIAQMGSSVKNVAIPAAEEVCRHGWHRDGSLQGAFLPGANLPGVNLDGADLEGANLRNAYMPMASLRRAKLQRVILTGANLQKTNLAWAKLQEAILGEANLQEANLSRADLQGAGLVGANLRGVNLLRANLDGALAHENTILPDGTKWTPDTDTARFTDPKHPDFWRPGA